MKINDNETGRDEYKPGAIRETETALDNLRARILKPDGTYIRAKAGNAPLDVQEWLMGHRQNRK